MAYQLERDGIAAHPDDPARVAAPEGWSAAQEARYDADWLSAKEWHADRIKKMTVSVMAGHIPSCPGLCKVNQVEKVISLGASELFEIITEDVDKAQLARLMVSPLDQDAKGLSWVWADELIDVYVDEFAGRLATEELVQEALA